LLTIKKRKSQEVLYAVTSRVDTLFLHIVRATITLISDYFLLLILAIGLLSLDIGMTFLTITLFTLAMAILYFAVQKRINYLAINNVELTINSNQKILEALSCYRDLYVRNRRSYYSKDISEIRFALANASAELSFIPSIGKYAIEISLVLGAILLCAIQFTFKNSVQAFSTLSVFLAATSRIAPAILRVQSALLTIKSNFGAADRTLSLIGDFGDKKELADIVVPLKTVHEGFNSIIKVENVSFAYPENDCDTICEASFEISPGEVIAFVGPSGAGKSTIVDLILGLLTPSQGRISISGLTPLDAIMQWPRAIGYVPQDVQIIEGTLKNNVAMGFPEHGQVDELVVDALKITQLSDLLIERDSDLNLKVGENGSQ
jgi:ABC-type multidrug transport system fused ATPase/permease subunit